MRHDPIVQRQPIVIYRQHRGSCECPNCEARRVEQLRGDLRAILRIGIPLAVLAAIILCVFAPGVSR